MALGRNNCLFAGSLRAGKRAAAAMSLMQSARLNGLDPWAYLKDVLEWLPAHPQQRIEEPLPHRWKGYRNLPASLLSPVVYRLRIECAP